MPLRFAPDGAEHLRQWASRHEREAIAVALPPLADRPGGRLHATPALAHACGPAGALGKAARRFVGPHCFPVRALLLDKRPGHNWAVGWHQDRTIAVRERIETAGYGRWSIKDGVPHVEPPARILQAMVTLRLHLDDVDVDVDNAPLLIAPGSHTAGRIDEKDVDATVAALGVSACLADAADIWAYATLILHTSQPARRLFSRRVLQVDFADRPLPGGLRWRGFG